MPFNFFRSGFRGFIDYLILKWHVSMLFLWIGFNFIIVVLAGRALHGLNIHNQTQKGNLDLVWVLNTSRFIDVFIRFCIKMQQDTRVRHKGSWSYFHMYLYVFIYRAVSIVCYLFSNTPIYTNYSAPVAKVIYYLADFVCLRFLREILICLPTLFKHVWKLWSG